MLLTHLKNQLIQKLIEYPLMQKRLQGNAYITVKDNKESFPLNPSFRPISPIKSNIGKVSKYFRPNEQRNYIFYTS